MEAMTAKKAEAALRALATPAKAARQMTFFKTGKGQYSAHDKFLGVTVPDIRKIAAEFRHLPPAELECLLRSAYNDIRLFALLVMVGQYERGDAATRERLYRLYMKNLSAVNNWNLVDASAHYIAGRHLLEKDRGVLYKLSKSKDMWERRVAIVATYAFIRESSHSDTLKLSAIYLSDKEDLMHKATGWMLREVGKKDVAVLEKFLKANLAAMPRTMLRYAIERFPEEKRKKILKGQL
jgi:3-methyladenine DNA glycosylase AlkD